MVIRKMHTMLLALALFLLLQPSAHAMSLLERPTVGQVVFLDADNALHYSADFPMSALSGAYRSADDLYLEFPAAKLILEDFFLPMSDWRSLRFSDGKNLSGSCFDENGVFTGMFHNDILLQKKGQESRLPARGQPLAQTMVKVDYFPNVSVVEINGSAVYGKMKNELLLAGEQMIGGQQPDWSVCKQLSFEFVQEADGSLRPMYASMLFHDGLHARIVNPGRLWFEDSLVLQPIKEGCSMVHYRNALGDELASTQINCYRKNDDLVLSSVCTHCGGEQGGTLHLLTCGHFSCAEEKDKEHGIAPCGIAGHCLGDPGHEKCGNCLSFLCDGGAHGGGLCQHVHDWVIISPFSSKCSGCGMVYSVPFPK